MIYDRGEMSFTDHDPHINNLMENEDNLDDDFTIYSTQSTNVMSKQLGSYLWGPMFNPVHRHGDDDDDDDDRQDRILTSLPSAIDIIHIPHHYNHTNSSSINNNIISYKYEDINQIYDHENSVD